MPVVITAVPFSNSASLLPRAFPFFLCFAAAFCLAFLSRAVSFFGCSGCCFLVSSAAEPEFSGLLPGLLLESSLALMRADARAPILGADLLAVFAPFVSAARLFALSCLGFQRILVHTPVQLLSPLSFPPLLELCPPLPSHLHPCPYLHALSSRLPPPPAAAHPPLAPPPSSASNSAVTLICGYHK